MSKIVKPASTPVFNGSKCRFCLYHIGLVKCCKNPCIDCETSGPRFPNGILIEKSKGSKR